MLIEERLLKLPEIHLLKGSHEDFAAGVCAMEAVAFLAGEPHSDFPACACPVISAFMRNWNDSLSDNDRDRLLKPYLPRLVGTRATPEIENKRAWMATDWLARECAPAWLRAAQLVEHADRLMSLAPILDEITAQTAQPDLDAARSAAWSAAESAAESAARSAANKRLLAMVRKAEWKS